jgi:hypothetical protein
MNFATAVGPNKDGSFCVVAIRNGFHRLGSYPTRIEARFVGERMVSLAKDVILARNEFSESDLDDVHRRSETALRALNEQG